MIADGVNQAVRVRYGPRRASVTSELTDEDALSSGSLSNKPRSMSV